MVSTALASILRSGRADFNGRFVTARRVHPELDQGAFADFLATAVDELIQAVEKVRPDCLGEVTVAAFDAALELVAHKLAGPGVRISSIEDGWRRILPKIPSLVASSSGRLIPAVCNALHQLDSSPGVRPTQWIGIMEKLGPECEDSDAFLKLGQVVAWRAGLAHLRIGAIAAADALPEALSLAALDAKSEHTWLGVREKLLANPWFDPASEPSSSSGLRVVAQAGSFKGFGGQFIQPPRVASSGDHFLVRSENECWLLMADVFGATFHPATTTEFEASQSAGRLPANLRINGSHVLFDGGRFEFPALGEFTSAAANETTLAITSRFTHSIILVALT